MSKKTTQLCSWLFKKSKHVPAQVKFPAVKITQVRRLQHPVFFQQPCIRNRSHCAREELEREWQENISGSPEHQARAGHLKRCSYRSWCRRRNCQSKCRGSRLFKHIWNASLLFLLPVCGGKKPSDNWFFPSSCAGKVGNRKVARIGAGVSGQCSVEEWGRTKKEGIELSY